MNSEKNMSKPMTSIRPAQPHDFEPIYALWIAHQSFNENLFEKSKAYFKKAFEEQDEDFKFFVCLMGPEIIGYVSLTPFREKNFFKGCYAEISIYVKREFRNSQIGPKLSRFATDYAADSKIKYIYGWINYDNRKLILLAKRQQWDVVGNIPPTLKGEPEMAKKLIVYRVPEKK